MKKQISIFTLFLLILPKAYALVELNGEYGLSIQKYGSNKSNEIKATSVSGAIAIYLFNRTAIEFNYSQTETVTEEKNVLVLDSTYDFVGSVNNVYSYSYGIGIRQAFAGRNARIRPSISLGYARQFIRDTTDAKFRNKLTGNIIIISDPITKIRDDSVFGSFALELRLTQWMSLRGSVKTIFKAFEFNQAQDNIRYMLGFSWYL